MFKEAHIPTNPEGIMLMREESSRLNPNERLHQNVSSFVDSLEAYNQFLPIERQRPPEDYLFLRSFYSGFISDRNNRADGVSSPEYERIEDLAKNLLPLPTFWVLCMDGRVKQIHTNGATAGVGTSIRVPGGNLVEFVRSKNGQMVLTEDTNFANLIDSAFEDEDIIAEVFDSHVGCAAREGEEGATGKKPGDKGLYSDVLHKKEMADATRHYVRDKYNGDKRVVTVQTSFDPHSGFMYMGLESAPALYRAQAEAQKNAQENSLSSHRVTPEFTDEILEALSNENKIISTRHLLHDETIQNIFEQYKFDIDWQNDYLNSAGNFWDAISHMKSAIEPILEPKIKHVFPHTRNNNPHHILEIKERAMLLLTNAFNAYLHNPTHHISNGQSHSTEEHSHYRYGEHEEQGIKISEGGHPPYDIAMFVINPGNLKTLAASVELASGIVRSNRDASVGTKPRITDWSGNYNSPAEFRMAPVPVVVQEIVRDQRLTEDDWEKLEKIDWSELIDPETEIAERWNTMSDAEFLSYLNDKELLSLPLVQGIMELRKKLAVLYDPNQPTSAHLIDQYKTALPIISDKSRRTRAIIPFIKLGHF